MAANRSTLEQRLANLPRAQRHHSAETVPHLFVWIHAERVQDCRCQVLWRVRVVGWIGGEAIRLAEHAATARRTAGDDDRIALRPMIAAGLIDAVASELAEPWRAAELAHAN